MYKLYIFDLDGTLIDSDAMLKVSLLEMYAKYRPDFDVPEGHTVQFSGPPIAQTLAKEFPKEDTEKLAKEFLEISKKNYVLYTSLFPGVEEILSTLLSLGKYVGVVTNKSRTATDYTFELLGLTDLVQKSVCGNEVEVGKPDPSGIFKLMKEFGISDKKEVIYIGDSEYDYLTAKNAGIDFGYVTWSPRKLDKAAKIAIKIGSFFDFAEKIKYEKD